VSVVLVHPVLMLLLLFLKLTRGVTLTSVMVRKLGVGAPLGVVMSTKAGEAGEMRGSGHIMG
jgi:hypothetical protein